MDSVTLLSFILQIIFKQFFDEIYSKNWISMNHSISIFSIDAVILRKMPFFECYFFLHAIFEDLYLLDRQQLEYMSKFFL